MKNILIGISLIFLTNVEANALKIVLASNHHSKDHSQAWGVANALKDLSPVKVSLEDLNAETMTPLEIKDKIEHDLTKGKVVFIGAGEGSIPSVISLPKDPNLTICLVSSSPLEQYKNKNLLEKVAVIALPAHAASAPDLKEQLGEKLIETTDVVHNRQPDMATYDNHKKELPPADIYLGVYLGGDNLTEEDVAHLAEYVTVKAEEMGYGGLKPCVLVLNNFQTAQHDQNGQELLHVQQDSKRAPITELFSNKLADNQVEYKVFDFYHTTPENEKRAKGYDAFDLVAGAVRTTKGKMIIPGEAIEIISETVNVMPSESIDTMPPGKALVYRHTVMNEAPKAHLGNQHAMGRVSILDNDGNVIPASDSEETRANASKVIAQKVLKLVSAQLPWTQGIYRSTKQEENAEKDKQILINVLNTKLQGRI